MLDLAFNEMTLLLLAVFAVFAFVVFKLVKIIFKVAVVAVVSMAFPVVLYYLGVTATLTLNSILFFGLLGTSFYIIFALVSRFVDVAWSAARPLARGKKKRRKEEVELE